MSVESCVIIVMSGGRYLEKLMIARQILTLWSTQMKQRGCGKFDYSRISIRGRWWISGIQY